MKRLKRVYSTSDQVLHLWANQTQSDARCSNVFFNGKSVWSYGSHYELGRLHDIKGKRIAVINSTKYSVTTSKHQSQARSAVSHLPTIHSSDVSNPLQGLLEMQGGIISSLFDFFSQRKFWSDYSVKADNYILGSVKEFNELCNVLNQPKLKLEVDDEFIQLMQEHVDLCYQRQIELNSPEALLKKEEKRLRSEALQLEKLKTHIQEWKNGGPLVDALRNVNPQLIRVNGTEVETTKGARVPFMQAKRLLINILSKVAKPGDKIGHFQLTRVQDDVVVLGCHTISINEAKEVLLKEGA